MLQTCFLKLKLLKLLVDRVRGVNLRHHENTLLNLLTEMQFLT